MSYILEALKESQRSRDEQRVPDIMTAHAAPESANGGRGPGRRIWVPLLLVLLAAGAGWWYAGQRDQLPLRPELSDIEPAAPAVVNEQPLSGQPLAPPSAPAAVNEPSVSGQPLSPPADSAVAASETQAAPQETALPAEPVAVAADSAPAPVAEPPVSLPQPATPREVIVAEAVPEPAAAAPVRTDSTAAQRTVPTPAEAVVDRDDRATSVAVGATESTTDKNQPLDESAPSVSAAEVPAEAAPVAVEPERIPHFRELPPDIQQAVAGVKYSVHIYSPNPERRLVKINGIVRRQGSEVSPGMVLEEVTPDGAIFTYRDYRFRVPVR